METIRRDRRRAGRDHPVHLDWLDPAGRSARSPRSSTISSIAARGRRDPVRRFQRARRRTARFDRIWATTAVCSSTWRSGRRCGRA